VTRTRRIVIVGASLAGATTAVTLRRLGFAGDLVLLGDEPHLPYERPALSKTYLSGGQQREALLVHPADTYDNLDIELQLGAGAAGLDADRREVRVVGGSPVGYDVLVIATGSENRRPPFPGGRLPGVHQLRSVDDADRLSADLSSATTAVIVGMGFIGCEVAATLRESGLDVTLVDRVEGPLAGQLGPELSQRVREWHEAHGVRLVGGVDVAALSGNGRVQEVRLTDGRSLPADVVVVGVGARPATDWLVDAPVHLVGGAVGADEAGRTSLPGVYAVGDVAATWSSADRTHRRTEHYRSALDQGARLAHTLLDLPAPAAQPSWFWSDQYDHVLHYAGDRNGTELHVRADPYTAFFLRGSVLSAVAAVDNGRDFRRALRLLGSTVDPRELVDPGVDLRRIAASDPAFSTAVS
jgi:3-phenylpropionate/trans-cinnamate dioxygenase ferredoxin reductase subunit